MQKNHNDTDSTTRTDPRRNPLTYIMASQVRLPDDCRRSPLQVVGISADHVSLRGSGGGVTRLDLSDESDIAFRYYSKTQDYWQPSAWLEPDDIDLLDDEGAVIDVDGVGYDWLEDTALGRSLPAGVCERIGEPQQSFLESAMEEMGEDTTRSAAPGEWTVLSPESEEAQESGLGALFDSKAEKPKDYSARVSPMGLVQLLRGQPVHIDWDETDLTLYPPVVEGGESDEG